MVQPTWLFSLLILTLQLSASGVKSTKLTVVNQCNYTVWPALDSYGEVKIATTGFVLRSGESFTVTPPAKWDGAIWGRTLCSNSSATGNFSCLTGDCGSGKIACEGKPGSSPVTLVEFAARHFNDPLDYYVVSLFDGFNLPVTIVPISKNSDSDSSNCSSMGCELDMNTDTVCPTELKAIINEQLVGCQTPCSVFENSSFCCNASSSCEPNVYSDIFMTTCPQAYMYPLDDASHTVKCSRPADYNITFCPTSTSSNNASQSVGASLVAGYGTSRWLSPSGDFAFGFYQLPNELFLLAVWYDKIPNKTIIWFANGDNLAPIRSKLELNDSRGLVLNNPQGLELWRSNFTSGTIFNGLMNDDGNFQLLDQNSVSIWETFTHPTDTLVPNQVMELNGKLFSRRGEFNFSHGRFKLHLQEDGNLVLYLINLPTNYSYEPYYDTGIDDANNQTNVGIKLIFDKSGFLYILKKSGEEFYIAKPNETISTNDFYYKATINYDGVFTVSYYPKDVRNEQGWKTTKTIPENICLNSNS